MTCPTEQVTAFAVDPVSEIVDLRDPDLELPIDHAAVITTLLPLLLLIVSLMAFVLFGAP